MTTSKSEPETEDGPSAEEVVLLMPVAEVRATLGRMWGLDRDLTRAELARALWLSPKFGGSHISKLEKTGPGKATLTGPIAVSLRMMLDGAVPPTMRDIVKPGYPRGLGLK